MKAKGSKMLIVEKQHIFLPANLNYKDQVLVYLSRNINKKVTINSISKGLKLAYGFLHETVQKLEKEKIVNVEEVGNYNLVSLNLKNPMAVGELTRISIIITQSIMEKSRQIAKLPALVSQLDKHLEILSIVLFGSQAKLEATEKSDIDIAIILREKNNNLTSGIRSEIRSFEVKEFAKIQEFIVDYEMFKRMAQSKEEINIGKEILKDWIILSGYENYWKLIGDSLG